MTFDLLEEPWIPVVRSDGRTEDLNLRQVLSEAPDLKEIRDPMPTVEFGLHRLLVALVTDVFALQDTDNLSALLKSGVFDRGLLESYFDRWSDRFDLFHSKYPFLQSPDTGDAQDKPKPLASLLPPIPSGTAANHFYHGNDQEFATSPAAAARLLTAVAPFMTAGGAGLSPSINGSPPWYILIQGQSLFETICLNCCVLPLGELDSTAPPAWRNPKPVEAKRCTKTGLLEALTWRPRKIRLIPGPGGHCSLMNRESPILVRTITFRAGASCDFTWTDPSVPYRITAEGPNVMRPQEGRELWRDIGPIALLKEAEYESEQGKIRFSRPRILDQFALLIENDILDRRKQLPIVAYGMRIKDLKMNFQEWQRERLELPVPLILNSGVHQDAQRAMEKAELAAVNMRKALKRLYPRNAEGNDKAFDGLAYRAQREYWSELRPEYELFLGEIATIPRTGADDLLVSCRNHWKETVVSTAYGIFDSTVGDFDTEAEILKRQVEAVRFLRRALDFIFETPEEKKIRTEKLKNKQTKQRKEEVR